MRSLPMISRCSETDCFYNRSGECHAPAINVGAALPNCVTFARTAARGHTTRRRNGVVGACHRADCRWNVELSCTAPGIEVGRTDTGPVCLTYEPAKG